MAAVAAAETEAVEAAAPATVTVATARTTVQESAWRRVRARKGRRVGTN